MIVVDASVLFHVLVSPRDSPDVLQALEGAGDLQAPHIIDAEILNSLRRNVLEKKISEERARQAVGDLGDFAIQRWPIAAFANRIWELRNNLTAYDASYVALSEALGYELYTRDRGIERAPGHKARIKML